MRVPESEMAMQPQMMGVHKSMNPCNNKSFNYWKLILQNAPIIKMKSTSFVDGKRRKMMSGQNDRKHDVNLWNVLAKSSGSVVKLLNIRLLNINRNTEEDL